MKTPKHPENSTPSDKAIRLNAVDMKRHVINRAPASFRSALERLYFKKPTRSLAIKMKCADCCNFDRDEVANCPCFTCPLWAFRPYKPNTEVSHSAGSDQPKGTK